MRVGRGQAALAQAYSEVCYWGHNGNRATELDALPTTFVRDDGSWVGENLYISSGYPETIGTLEVCPPPLRQHDAMGLDGGQGGVQGWFDEYLVSALPPPF